MPCHHPVTATGGRRCVFCADTGAGFVPPPAHTPNPSPSPDPNQRSLTAFLRLGSAPALISDSAQGACSLKATASCSDVIFPASDWSGLGLGLGLGFGLGLGLGLGLASCPPRTAGGRAARIWGRGGGLQVGCRQRSRSRECTHSEARGGQRSERTRTPLATSPLALTSVTAGLRLA